MLFLPLARFFILARILVFLANRDKKYIYPKGIFSSGKFTFWRGKNLLRVEKCNSWVNARHFSSFGITKKVLCFSKVILAFGPFLGFFGLKKAFGLLQAKNTHKNGLQAKNMAAAQKMFLSFLMLILSCISTLKYTIFWKREEVFL